MRFVLLLALTALASHVVTAQQPRVVPTAPGTAGDPKWQRLVNLTDGRTFISDGGLAIDRALLEDTKLPSDLVAIDGKVMEGYMSKAGSHEYGLRELTADADGKTYSVPSSVKLNSTYVNYLRRMLPASSLRLRMSGPTDPVTILIDGKAVGIVMPVR